MHAYRIAVVCVLCCASMQAQERAVLSGRGTVTVNGSQTTSAAVASGDTVFTGENGFASLIVPGTNVVLGKKTTSTLEPRKLVLRQGSASITTTSAYAVEIASLLVTPESNRARFDVSHVACRISITARAGILKLSDGSLVRAGQTVSRAEPNCANLPNSSASSTAANSIETITVGGAAIGGSALGALVSSSEPKASPSRPR